MQYNYFINKDINGNYHIKFICNYDKLEFINDLLLTLKEIIPNWIEIKDVIQIIDPEIEYLINDYKKEEIHISEEDFGGSFYPIDNFIYTEIGKINIKITGKKVEIESIENNKILKLISDILENDYLFNKVIE